MAGLHQVIFTLLVLELAGFRGGLASPQVMTSESELREMIEDTISNSLQKLEASLGQFCSSNQQQPQPKTATGSCPAGNNDGSSPCRPACSCAEILSSNPNAPSGDYWIRTSDGRAQNFFCDMNRTCSGVTGAWTRVGYLDITKSTQACPSGLLERTVSDKRACAALSDGPTCSSVIYQAPPYSRVCGKVRGYFGYTLDGFEFHDSGENLDDNYVDGVSITHGKPRAHIWTYAVACTEKCVCATPPTAVGDDYFCDYRDPYTTDLVTPVWSKPTCGQTNSTAPWFFQELQHPTTDPVEMRVCRDEKRDNEDLLLEAVEIYVL